MIKKLNIGSYLQVKYMTILHEIEIGNGTECDLFNSLGNEFLSIADHYEYFNVNRELMKEFVWWGFFFKERAKIKSYSVYTSKTLQPVNMAFH